MLKVEVVLRNPKMAMPVWLKAKALTPERAAMRLLLIIASKQLHARKGRSTVSRVAIAYIDYLDTLVGFEALVLVLEKKTWGVVGNFLKEQKGRTDNRIVLLRVDWAGRGRELRRLDEIKRSI